MKKGIFLIAIFSFLCVPRMTSAPPTALWKEGISLIPYPQEVSLGGGDFVLVNGVNIMLDNESSEADRFTAADLVARLKEDLGFESRVGGSPGVRSILLTRRGAPNKVGDQGYELTVTKTRSP